ncbi:MAG: acyltransferase family protein [Lachnospiraceae bacterium]|nr:acyltransferase family protein [Lachnospiraceae bacterium]
MKHRIELIDISKAITIILVILGHTTGNLDTPMYRRLIYAFHMPLFFFLSGMSTKPKTLKSFGEWKKNIGKDILALIVPYVLLPSFTRHSHLIMCQDSSMVHGRCWGKPAH